MPPTPSRRSRLLDLLPTRRQHEPQPLDSGPSSPDSTLHPPHAQYSHRSLSPSYSDPFQDRGDMSGQYSEDLAPPSLPFGGGGGRSSGGAADGSGLSSRRSSFSSLTGGGDKKDAKLPRPASLSVNYVPAKFTKPHAPGDWAHRRAKQGGGRDAFASNAQRMGQIGTVDDDEGVVFQLGKGGLKRKKPKLRWNRFKWVLFGGNSLLIVYGLVGLVSAILVWLNVFYQSDVIRVGNRVELILSTVAASLIVFTALLGFAGILMNNRAFLAVYTLLLWVCLAFMVAPGYMTYKQRTFNLEGKINLQYSRNLGTAGRLRIQDALRCCGYFSPYVEATQSPLCYARSTLPGCKSRYLHLERRVLGIWYTVAFSLVPPHILIIVASLLCSNHITYRFGKGLTPKRYRLDLGSMAVIMDEYANQIAAQYGPSFAQEIRNRSSVNLVDAASVHGSVDSPKGRHSFLAPALAASTSVASPSITKVSSRLAPGTASINGSNAATRGSALYDPSRTSLDAGSVQGGRYHDNNDGDRGDESIRYADSEYEGGGNGGYGYTQPREYAAQ